MVVPLKRFLSWRWGAGHGPLELERKLELLQGTRGERAVLLESTVDNGSDRLIDGWRTEGGTGDDDDHNAKELFRVAGGLGERLAPVRDFSFSPASSQVSLGHWYSRWRRVTQACFKLRRPRRGNAHRALGRRASRSDGGPGGKGGKREQSTGGSPVAVLAFPFSFAATLRMLRINGTLRALSGTPLPPQSEIILHGTCGLVVHLYKGPRPELALCAPLATYPRVSLGC